MLFNIIWNIQSHTCTFRLIHTNTQHVHTYMYITLQIFAAYMQTYMQIAYKYMDTCTSWMHTWKHPPYFVAAAAAASCTLIFMQLRNASLSPAPMRSCQHAPIFQVAASHKASVLHFRPSTTSTCILVNSPGLGC